MPPETNEPKPHLPTVVEKLAGVGGPPPASSVLELLEKNLKWSQILYEQNRRINRKLFWMTLAGWLRFIILVIPLILAVWFLPPLFRQLERTYGSFLRDAEQGRVSPGSLQEILKMLPLGAAEREQLKNFLK